MTAHFSQSQSSVSTELMQLKLFYFNIGIATLTGSDSFGEEGAHPSS